MQRSSRRLLKAAVVVMAIAGCGGSISAGSASTEGGVSGGGGSSGAMPIDSGMESGTGGSGGLIIEGGGGVDGQGVPECPWPINATQGASTSWLQQQCDGTFSNPLACPGAVPDPGSSCSVEGLTCAYGTGSAFSELLCDGIWKETGIPCAECDGPKPGVAPIDVSMVACGSNGDVGCAGSSDMTNAMLLTATLESIAECCGMRGESTLTVMFNDGCATTVYGSNEPLPFADCFAATLAGRRLACAADQTCASITWSTLP